MITESPWALPHWNFVDRLRHLESPGLLCGQKLGGCPVDALREALAWEAELLRQKEALLRDRELLRQESDHRILNGLQVIISLLRLQGGSATNPDVAAQLSVAANRVAAIERIHRRLRSQDSTKTIALNQYLSDIVHDFAALSTSRNVPTLDIRVGGGDIEISGTIAVSLGFVVSELLTNAIKYGNGRITVSLESGPARGYALSVSNDGPSLPDGFDPARCNGLGMKIIRALVQKIGGEFGFGRAEKNQGAKFIVLFS